ncbi:MAG: exodeoxyribonuclease VII large subunit [Actinomycetia bacterium]|nr:exodeoxyribonuclease VII large subunit [Actinomycetes bacterium]
MTSTTWGVSELIATVNELLEGYFPDEVWVQGEIRNLNRSRAGHVYFDLVEPDGDNGRPAATIPVALFARDKFVVNAVLKKSGSMRMTDGIELRIRGRVRIWEGQGRFQLVMSMVDPTWTLGRLAEDREALLAALRADGLLDRNRTLTLPTVPLELAVVTSDGSAACADFLDELDRSGYGFRIVLVDTAVQGADAPPALARALLAAARRAPIVALVRGGGARTDLATFDNGLVARTIAGLDRPVITGIGHETDQSIADVVAHSAHKTPTACAAALVEAVAFWQASVEQAWYSVGQRAAATLTTAGHGIDRSAEHVRRNADRQIHHAEREIDRQAAGISRHATAVPARAEHALRRRAGAIERTSAAALAGAEHGLTATAESLTRRPARLLAQATRLIDTLDGRRRLLDPSWLMDRGWSIVTDTDGRLVRGPDDAAVATELAITGSGGSVRAVVIDDDTARKPEPNPEAENHGPQ